MQLYRRHPWWRLLYCRHLHEGPNISRASLGETTVSDSNEEHDCTDDIFERGTYIIEGISGGINHSEERGVEEEDDSSLATLEVCHFTDGHQEHILSQPVGQGVYKTPGEAPTGKRSGQSRDQDLLRGDHNKRLLQLSSPTTGDPTGPLLLGH